MLFSIIVPTCNRPDTLKTCIDSLIESRKFINDKCEIIISDDSNDDLTNLLINTHYLNVKYVNGPKKGPAANRNSGFKSALGEWLIFIDDDCIPDKEIIKAYVSAIKEFKDIKAFEGMIDIERPQNRLNESTPLNLNGGLFWTCNVCINRNIFTQLGLFDERLGMSMEDVAFRELLKHHGYEIKFIREAKVIHPWKRETIKWMIEDGKHKYASTLMFKKYYGDLAFSEKICSKHYFNSAIYGFYYGSMSAKKFLFKGYFSVLFKSMLNIIYGINFNKDFKKI